MLDPARFFSLSISRSQGVTRLRRALSSARFTPRGSDLGDVCVYRVAEQRQLLW